MSTEVAAALTAFTGWDTMAWPQHDAEAVKRMPNGTALLARIESLMAETDDYPPCQGESLVDAMNRMTNAMRVRHPDLDERSLKLIAWAYSYGWK